MLTHDIQQHRHLGKRTKRFHNVKNTLEWCYSCYATPIPVVDLTPFLTAIQEGRDVMSIHHLIRSSNIKIRDLNKKKLDTPSNVRLDIENIAACRGQQVAIKNVEQISEGDFL